MDTSSMRIICSTWISVLCEHLAWLFLCFCCTALHARSHLARDNPPHSTPERCTLDTRHTLPCHTGRNTRSFLSQRKKSGVSFKIHEQQRFYLIQAREVSEQIILTIMEMNYLRIFSGILFSNTLGLQK